MVKFIDKLRQRLTSTPTDEAMTQFDNLFDIAADGIIVFDHRQRIVRFNKGAETVFGYTKEEVTGKPIDILLPSRFTESHKDEMRAFAAEGKQARLMGERRGISGRRKNGEEFPAEASISTAVVNGKPVFYTILRDISQRKQTEKELRKSEERFRGIFEHTNDAILIINPMAGTIVDVNPIGCRMFGFSHAEMTKMMIADIHPKDSPRFRKFAQSVVKQGDGWTDELICMTKSGEHISAEISASLVDFGDKRLMIALFRDITERKKVEQMKSDFVSNVSHELRTPLTSMKLYTHLMMVNPKNNEKYMQRMVREVERQEYIIEDLLRLSRLDHGDASLVLKPTDLNILAAEFVVDRAPLARTRQLTLTFEGMDELPLVMADRNLVAQVLSVLITNALNYTPENGRVTVTTTSKESNWAGFRVSDTGIGIDPEDREHLFERFYRGVVGRQSEEPGTGLGLAIAKEIIERHQGQIEIESTGVPGEGTTFTIWLPTNAVPFEK